MREYLPHRKVSRKKGNVATAITVTLELRALRSGVVLIVPNRDDALVVIETSWPGLDVEVRADPRTVLCGNEIRGWAILMG